MLAKAANGGYKLYDFNKRINNGENAFLFCNT